MFALQVELERECEKVQLEHEKLKFELERLRLALSQHGRPHEDDDTALTFEIRTNLTLVLTLNEKDLDWIFCFKCVAESGNSNHVLMLHCVLTGKAQEAFCSLAAVPNLEYTMVCSENI